MKTTILILISAFTIFGVQAQSKKAINQTLRAQLMVVENTADSIHVVHKVKQNEVRKLQNDMVALGKLSMSRKRDEESHREDIRFYHQLLKEYHFDANTLVPLTEIDAMISPATVEGYLPNQAILTQTVILTEKPEISDVSEEKMKVQNQMLQNKIDEFKAVNAKNLKSLLEEQKLITDLKNAKTTFSGAIDKHGLFNMRLDEKENVLRLKITALKAIKEEQDRLKWEKEQALEAKKNKGKKPKFVEPVIVDKYIDGNYYDQEGGYELGVDIKQSDDWMSVPPPPPVEAMPPPTPPEIFDVVEQPAEFTGGREALVKFLDANLKMPAVAEELGINGKVYLRFVVSESGNVSNVRVVKGISDCKECDEEAVRVVKSMPDWIPGRNYEKPVNCWYTLPVIFNANK